MSAPGPGPNILDRYALFDEIASGGMAIVHFGRAVGAAGFSRPVAIKRLHPQYARDPEFVSMFLDEARLAARVHHPNVVSTLDVVALEGELFLVLEYVHGESLAGLLRASRERGQLVPPAVGVAIVSGALHGLHAAHEATDNAGAPMCIVHRDVSPHNLLVGVDGAARVLDFGVAKAAVRSQTTREGQLKGKLKYMAPEQLRGVALTRTADVYSAGVVLWEVLTGERLFEADNEAALFGKVLEGVIAPPSRVLPSLPRALDAPILRALERDPSRRFATAREMAIALESAVQPASPTEVGDWVSRTARAALAQRAASLRAMDAGVSAPPMAAAGSSRTPGARTQTQTQTAAPAPASSRPPPLPPSVRPPPVSVRPRAPSQLTLTAVDAGNLRGAPADAPVSSPTSSPASSPASLPVPVASSAPVPQAPAPPRGRGAIAFAALATLALAASIAFASRAGRPVVVSVARDGLANAADLAYGAAILTTYDADAEPVETAPDASGAPTAEEPALPPTPGVARPRRRPRPSASAAPSVLARPDCDPPYYEDARGIRRVKRHCLP
jgi:serine/threonine-protein kinase